MNSRREHDHSNENSRDGSGPFWGHTNGLFDQNEDIYGETYDAATGERIDNSTEKPEDYGLTVVKKLEDAESDDQYDRDYIDAWLETQRGLANAAGISFEDTEDIA